MQLTPGTRDYEYKNIMMDASAMYPQGFHPSRWAPYVSRRSVGVQYYFADFGLSSHFPPEAQSRLVVGDAGRDQ